MNSKYSMTYKNVDGKLVEAGYYYTRRNGGTTTHFRQISKEEYDRYKSMKPSEVTEEVERSCNKSQLNGYGYYGYELAHDDKEGLYFLGKILGNTCD